MFLVWWICVGLVGLFCHEVGVLVWWNLLGLVEVSGWVMFLIFGFGGTLLVELVSPGPVICSGSVDSYGLIDVIALVVVFWFG